MIKLYPKANDSAKHGQSNYLMQKKLEKDERIKVLENKILVEKFNSTDLSELFYLISSYKDYEKMLYIASELEKIYPASSISANTFGMVHYYKSNYEEAIKFFQTAIKRNEFYLDAHNNLACTYGQLEDYSTAVKILEDRTDEVGVLNLVTAYLSLGCFDKAELKLSKFLKENTSSADAFFIMGKIALENPESGNSALVYFNKAQDLQGVSIEILSQKFIYYTLKFQFDKAIKESKSLLKLDPDNILANLFLGAIHGYYNHLKQAEYHLNKVLGQNDVPYYLEPLIEESRNFIKAINEIKGA